MRFTLPPSRSPSALGMVQLYNGTAAWRVIWPMDYLNRLGYRTTWGFNAERETSAAIENADVVVMHRLAWAPGDEGKAVAWRDLLHRNGKALVYDHDDDLVTPDIIERVQQTLPPESDKTAEDIDRERRCHLFSIALCDGVLCSTERLASVTRPLTDRPVVVVPNAIDLGRFRSTLSVESVDPDRPLTIGWVGGNRPDSDAYHLARAWKNIAGLYRDVRFRVAYYEFPALLNAVPADRLDYIPRRTIDAYARSYAGLDIGCAPLLESPFNLAKSPIKAWEYAAAGAAVVASPTVYSSVIRHGVNGAICRTADDWTAAIAGLIDNAEYRRTLASNLLREVEQKWSLEANAHNWPEAWARIRGSFQVGEMRAALRGRKTSYDVPVAPRAE